MASRFAKELDTAAAREDGIAVSRLLSITHSDLKALASSTNEAMVNSDLRKRLRDPLWGDVAVAFWRVAIQVMIKQDLVEAYSAQNALLTAANRIAEKADNWVLPVLSTISKELRQLSIMADGKDGSREKLEEATRTINRSFTICLNDRNLDTQRSKKWGVYFFVGELFKVYFKLNKQPLAKSVVKVLHTMTKDLPPLDQYPKAHVTTFLYYWGVLLFIDQDYVKAEEKLTEAYNKCFHKSTKNKELILTYLIPIRIINSQSLPSDRLFSHYPRLAVLYADMVSAIKNGNIGGFDAVIKDRRSVLVKKYLYSSTEHLRLLTSWLLLYRVYKLDGKSTRLEVKKFAAALQFAGYYYGQYVGPNKSTEENDDHELLDEAECLIATLISHGQVKGYISHERRIVVLSNNCPFPQLAGS